MIEAKGWTTRHIYLKMLLLLNFLWFPAFHLVTSSKFNGTAYVNSKGLLYYENEHGHIHTLVWAVKLIDESHHSLLAKQLGLISLGQVGHLWNHILFAHPLHLQYVDDDQNHTSQYGQEFSAIQENIEKQLLAFSYVQWFKQEIFRPRSKRSMVLRDPEFSQQWHLNNTVNKGMDINVSALWDRNITGDGVTVCIVDDGLEWNHPDLKDNYNALGSWDLNDDDPDPSPAKDGKKNEHGTRCAGEVAAAANDICGVGVAFRAKISAIKVLDGKMTDSLEATAFTKNIQHNDIYSCSWGPEDDGKTIDGPHYLSRLAIEHGTRLGRDGYGAIYVVASGNGGMAEDDCNFDGYANSIYTITIGAVDEYGQKPFYAESCSCLMAVTFSSGSKPARSIVTTDWTEHKADGCTTLHSGTSAAAPLAAAIIALALQVNPCLSWRDVQYLIILASIKVDNRSSWDVNSAGLHHSNDHGFGLLTAWRLVNAAMAWTAVPWMSTFATGYIAVNEAIPHTPGVMQLNYTVTAAGIGPYFLWVLEHVQLRVTIKHRYRGRLHINLICPSGTKSILAPPRPNDDSKDGFDKYTFSTVRCWGENPIGNWTLQITDTGGRDDIYGNVKEWELVLHGTDITASNFEERKRLVEDAASGKYLNDINFTVVCSPPPIKIVKNINEGLSVKGLKILLLVGGFATFLAIFETFEYLLCYDEEKKKFAEKLVSDGNRNRRQCEGDQTLATDENDGLLACDTLNHTEISLGVIQPSESENVTTSANETITQIQVDNNIRRNIIFIRNN